MKFIDNIKERVRKNSKTIVLPETSDIRTIEAARKITDEGFANIILVGEKDAIYSLAKDNNIDIRLYTIIYKLVEDIEAAINGMLDPEYEEKVLGSAEVRKIFKFSKIGNIAGSYITSGIVKNGAMARVIRDGVVIASDEVIASLQREKDTVKEVKKGFECGITLEKFNDFKEGDTIEAYEMVEVKHA